MAFTSACEAGHCLEMGDSGMPEDPILLRNNKRPDEVISCDREELATFIQAFIDGRLAV